MAIFVYTETDKNGFTPISLETVSFAKKIASQKKEELIALCINTENPDFLQKFGANKIISIHSDSLTTFNAQCYAQILAKHINGLTIFPHTIEGQAISGVLSVLKKSSLITQVNSYPESLSPFILKKNIFSEKAEMNIYPDTENLILTIMPYVFNIKEIHEIAIIESYHIEIDNPFKLIHKEEKNSKKDLTTSDIVVCAGRGLKSPENWKMIEELAEVLNGATACTRPVSDMGWRDYNEHAILALAFLELHNILLVLLTQKLSLLLTTMLMLIFSNMQITESSVMHSKLFLLSQKKSENSKINLHTKFIFF